MSVLLCQLQLFHRRLGLPLSLLLLCTFYTERRGGIKVQHSRLEQAVYEGHVSHSPLSTTVADCLCQKTFQFGDRPLGLGKLPLQKAASPQVAPSGVALLCLPPPSPYLTLSLPLSCCCSAMLMRAWAPWAYSSLHTKQNCSRTKARFIILRECYVFNSW